MNNVNHVISGIAFLDVLLTNDIFYSIDHRLFCIRAAYRDKYEP